MMETLHNSAALALARRLIQFDTIMGGSGERAALEHVAEMLEDAGFGVRLDEYDAANPGCCSLCAHLNPGAEGPALCLAGHIDTVPLGQKPWAHDPFAGDIVDNCLYGRGSCDMKAGVACLVSAACAQAAAIKKAGKQDLVLQFYGGEEQGCLGSFHLAQSTEDLARVRGVLVGEPTGSRPLIGHKGALWIRLSASGKTAHASMPEKGESALAKLVPVAGRLLGYAPGGDHPYLGRGTAVLSTLHAGLNTNSVPDLASLTLDIRSVPGRENAALIEEVLALAGEGISSEILLDIPPVWTDPDSPWVQDVLALWGQAAGKDPEIATVQFFTDAAALRPVLPDVPMIILGPGESSMAHVVDEACPVSQITFMESLYSTILEQWYLKHV